MSMLRRIVTPPRLIMAVFFMHSVVTGNWLQRIPDVQARLAVGPDELSIGLLGAPIGTLISLFFAGPIVARLTPRRTMLFGFVAYYFAYWLPGWAWSVASLFAALFVVGVTQPIVDVAMNVEADRIERGLGGRRIMSTCHGFWSIGLMTVGLIGAGFAATGMAPPWHVITAAVAALPVALSIVRALPADRPAPAEGTPPPRIALPTWSLLPLCFFSFGMLVVESAGLDWTTVFLRDVVQISPGLTGIGFAAFALFMAAGRLVGDRLAERFGPVALARGCCLICLAGVVGLVTSASFAQSLVSLAAIGFGVSVAVPLSVTAAAGRGDRPAAVNVAALSQVAFTGFLIEPRLVGATAGAWGLRIGLAMVIPLIVTSLLLAGELRRRIAPAGRVPPNPLSEIAT